MYEQIAVAPAGSTSNNTHAGVPIDSYLQIAFEFVVEAVGGTPTVTWKIQATLADPSVADANAAWYDLAYITDASDTVAVAAKTATGVGSQVIFLSNAIARRYRRFRLVTSSNTNVTYHATATRIR